MMIYEDMQTSKDKDAPQLVKYMYISMRHCDLLLFYQRNEI